MKRKAMGKSNHLVSSWAFLLRGLLLQASASTLVQASSKPHSKGPLFSRQIPLNSEEGADNQACFRKCSGDKSCSVAIAQPKEDGHVSCVHLLRQDQTKRSPLEVRDSTTSSSLSETINVCEHGSYMEDGVCVCLKEKPNSKDLQYRKPDECTYKSLHIFFEKTDCYHGRLYLFGLHDIRSVRAAQDVCTWYGGYLAEIDDAREDKFVNDFSYEKKKAVELFWIGGSDETTEGNWVFSRTGKPVKFTSWGPMEPNGCRTENCLSYLSWDFSSLVMNDVSCTPLGWPNSSSRFICEISQEWTGCMS